MCVLKYYLKLSIDSIPLISAGRAFQSLSGIEEQCMQNLSCVDKCIKCTLGDTWTSECSKMTTILKKSNPSIMHYAQLIVKTETNVKMTDNQKQCICWTCTVSSSSPCSGNHSNCTALPLTHGEMVRLDEGRFPALELNNRRLSVKNSFCRKNGIYTRSVQVHVRVLEVWWC